MAFAAKILADSVGPRSDARLVTFEITFPRPFLAELNTHKMLSKNSASSRAIPVEKMIQRVLDDPYIPQSWGKNQKGMQATEEVTAGDAALAEHEWLLARDTAILSAKSLMHLGIHKQFANRLLEPFMWHTCIITGTEWSNFFHLRNNPMAQPEMQTIAAMMQQLYKEHEPEKLDYGEWHLPLISPEDYDAAFEQGIAQQAGNSVNLAQGMVKISVGRCARVSYLTHDGKRDLKADIELHDSLLKNGHLSPFEHVATPNTGGLAMGGHVSWSGNLREWRQYRKTIPHEADILAPRTVTP